MMYNYNKYIYILFLRMKKKFNLNKILKNVESLKKKSKTHKSQRSMDHLKAEQDYYFKDIYNNSDLIL